MNSITKMITKALAATGSPVSLLVENTPEGFCASLVNVESTEVLSEQHLGETMTLETDWDATLVGCGATVEAALAALDELCSVDFLTDDESDLTGSK